MMKSLLFRNLYNSSTITVLPDSRHKHGREGLVASGTYLHLGDEHSAHEDADAVLAPRYSRVVAASQSVKIYKNIIIMFIS